MLQRSAADVTYTYLRLILSDKSTTDKWTKHNHPLVECVPYMLFLRVI